MFSIADSAAAKFGFETAMVICGKIVNQDGSLSQVHTTPGTAEDADSIPSTEVEGCDESLQWLKKAIAKQVTKFGGKFASDKNFPWKTMPSALASGGLNIEGYPAHKCLMLGESHDPTSKNNKGIGVLMLKEVAALVDAFKAGIMQVVKSSNTPTSLIKSTEPVIIGEAPPSTWEHASAHRMFADQHTDYGGPEHVGTSVAQTRVKKGKNRARDPKDGEAVMSLPPVMSPPPACPFKVVTKPISFKPLLPPPTCPFRVVAKPTAPMAPKAAAQEVIELTSTSEGSRDVTVKVDTEYEDDSHRKKQKLKLGSSSQVSKKCVSAEVVIEPKKEAAQPVQPAARI
ncbi:hypothetical protein BDR07DRAFT_1383980 [Suillus spraguei]|nr:hypothetical protein BDR07DRAFT_1383980 [Suillus spraguei]